MLGEKIGLTVQQVAVSAAGDSPAAAPSPSQRPPCATRMAAFHPAPHALLHSIWIAGGLVSARGLPTLIVP